MSDVHSSISQTKSDFLLSYHAYDSNKKLLEKITFSHVDDQELCNTTPGQVTHMLKMFFD